MRLITSLLFVAVGLASGCAHTPKVAAAELKELSGKFSSQMHENYEINLLDSAKGAHIDKFWKVDDKVLNLAERLSSNIPSTGSELINSNCNYSKQPHCLDPKAVEDQNSKRPLYSFPNDNRHLQD